MLPPPPIGDLLKWFHGINFLLQLQRSQLHADADADRGSSKQNELIYVVDLPICLFVV